MCRKSDEKYGLVKGDVFTFRRGIHKNQMLNCYVTLQMHFYADNSNGNSNGSVSVYSSSYAVQNIAFLANIRFKCSE